MISGLQVMCRRAVFELSHLRAHKVTKKSQTKTERAVAKRKSAYAAMLARVIAGKVYFTTPR